MVCAASPGMARTSLKAITFEAYDSGVWTTYSIMARAIEYNRDDACMLVVHGVCGTIQYYNPVRNIKVW